MVIDLILTCDQLSENTGELRFHRLDRLLPPIGPNQALVDGIRKLLQKGFKEFCYPRVLWTRFAAHDASSHAVWY
jgi:hypothetical protein